MQSIAAETCGAWRLTFEPPIQVPDDVEINLGVLAAYGAYGPDANTGTVTGVAEMYKRDFERSTTWSILRALAAAVAEGGHVMAKTLSDTE